MFNLHRYETFEVQYNVYSEYPTNTGLNSSTSGHYPEKIKPLMDRLLN